MDLEYTFIERLKEDLWILNWKDSFMEVSGSYYQIINS